MSSTEELIHGVAAAVAVDPDGPLAGALILGPSGSGKSALVFALIDNCPWRRTALVADDAVLVSGRDGAICARAPERIKGLLEVRGVGPVKVRTVSYSRIVAGFDLAAPAERLPEPERRVIAGCEGVALPLWPLAGGGAGAARARLILRSILGGQTPDCAHDRDDSKRT
ncbi:MAG: HPr kinase/phosphorylase [Parvularculaceae bacterium]